MTTHLVFVYGSLKAGFHNHRLLKNISATELGYAVTDERYLLLKGVAFPYLIKGADLVGHGADHLESRIAGELYRVSDKGLERLDALEGHPSFYRRETIKVNDGIATWAYFLTRADWRLSDHDGLETRPWATPNADGIAEWTRDDVCAVSAQDDREE